MAKPARTTKQASKGRPAPAPAKSRTPARTPARAPSKPKASSPVSIDPGRSGWATDLVFDVREPKLAVSLRLDADVLRFFRGFGAGYQTRINEVLKAFMHARMASESSARPVPPSRQKQSGAGNGKRVG